MCWRGRIKSSNKRSRKSVFSGQQPGAVMQLANRISRIIKTIYGCRVLIAALLVALSAPAQAQQPTKISRIGFLSTNSRESMSSRAEAFRRGLRELGYVDGKNISIEYRYAEG